MRKCNLLLATLVMSGFAHGQKYYDSVGVPIASPVDAVNACSKGCVVLSAGQWLCLTRAEVADPKYAGRPSACRTLPATPAENRALSAVAKLRERAENGDADAQFALGFEFESGRNLTRDNAEAARWYRAAAERGHSKAQTNLGVMYANGRGVAKDAAEAVRLYRLAAENGNGYAQFNLGRAYARGQGITRNETIAAAWILKAAQAGVINAYAYLGRAYTSGAGVDKDRAEGIRWYRKAAASGDDEAQTILDQFYASAPDMTQTDDESLEWFRVAAKSGDKSARYRLVELYSGGQVAARTDIDLSSPEATLAGYLRSISTGDPIGVLERYAGHGFYLREAKPIEDFAVVKRHAVTERDVENWESQPPSMVGDMELQVAQIEGGEEHMYSYRLRKSQDEWKIIAHVRWD